MPSPVDIRQLSFSYGSRQALNGVTFEVPEKKIFGLLGPNGGGKTTLFRILCGLLPPAEGAVTVFGLDLQKEILAIRHKTGVVFQSPSLDLKLSVRENLILQGHMYGLSGTPLQKRSDEVLALLNLSDRNKDKVQTLSGGLRRRVEIAKALLHGPTLLILDEPSTGLDPGARIDLWRALTQLRDQQGVTVLLTTHLMEEAERCDILAILNQGNLVAIGPPESLKGTVGGDVLTIVTPDPEEIRKALTERFNAEAAIVEGQVRLEMPSAHTLIPLLVEAFPGKIQGIHYGKPTLEDVFIDRTGHQFLDNGGPAHE